MGKSNMVSELQVLRFFQESSIEKAEVVFNIVAEKMRERLVGRRDISQPKESGTERKSRATVRTEAPSSGELPPKSAA